MGLSARWYEDLEAYPDDVVSTVSLAQLQVLGRTLGLEPATIFVRDTRARRNVAELRDVVEGLQRRMGSEGLDAEALGERLGWEIRGALANPEELWSFNVTGLRDVCPGMGVDWLAVLPRLK